MAPQPHVSMAVLGVKVQGFDLKGLTLRFKLFNLEGQKRSSG